MGPTPISSSNLAYLNEFRRLNDFYRCLGYTFIGNDFTDDGRYLTLTRQPSPYTAYAAITWLVIIGVFAYDASEAVNMYEDHQILDKAATLVYTVRTISVQVCCFLLAFTQAPGIIHVSRYLADLEAELAYPVQLNNTARNLIVINLILTVALVLSIIPVLFFFDKELSVNQLIWNSCYLLVNVFHGQSSCLVVYILAMFFAETLAALVASINSELRHVLDAGDFVEDARCVQQVHGLFVRVTDAFDMCDQILGKFMLVIFPLNLTLAAPWGYWVMKELDNPVVSLPSALGFAALCTQMLLAKKTWDVLTKLLVSQEHTPEVREQIQEFRHTCQNQDFSFSGCGFFKVGPPLIVSQLIQYTDCIAVEYYSTLSDLNSISTPILSNPYPLIQYLPQLHGSELSLLSKERSAGDGPSRDDSVCKRPSPHAVYAAAGWIVLATDFDYDSYEVPKMFADFEPI
ncbi:hypothetical protein HPB50_025136 [Hyalomma asiaticum]|uniref:Uncharacterized protein n=1 Tax=Hyalomma asiaticum TaxID=266040 RepID=A0ACB7RSM9_HYAAI|nr:hypothetical protein HPB50_025136 [Hyalomma asiaticum]